MKDVVKIYGHLVYFTAISYILWPLGMYILWTFWYTFSRFGMLYQEKSGNSESETGENFHYLFCLRVSELEAAIFQLGSEPKTPVCFRFQLRTLQFPFFQKKDLKKWIGPKMRRKV
jgi:hypothetical protein